MKLAAFSTFVFGAFAAVNAARGPVPYAKGAKAVDIEILQYALTLEHLEAKFYADALARFSGQDFANAGYGPVVRQRLTQIASHEATHVTALSGIISSLGATPNAPCVYKFPYTDVNSFLALSSVIEGVGVSAYLYKSQFINEKAYLVAAASILAVEARHQTLISEFQKQDGVPSPFDTPLTGSEVFSIASPFFVSCPKGNVALPFATFPALGAAVSGTPAAGSTVTFTLPKGVKGDVYINFFNGLSNNIVKLVSGQAKIPAGYTGTVYAVASSNPTGRADDNTTIAGPAIIVLPNPDATTVTRRSIEFSA